MTRKDHNEDHQGDHHDLADALDAVLNTDTADQDAENNCDDHVAYQLLRGSEHVTEDRRDALAVDI